MDGENRSFGRTRVLFGAIAFAMALTGCTTTHQVLEEGLFYKRDIGLEINGKTYEGVTVLPDAESYAITIIPPGEADLALISSCHRETAIEKADSGWSLFGKKKKFTYQYTPVKGIEDKRVCPLRIQVFESVKGRHSWALLEKENKDYQLKFSSDCDGKHYEFNGVGICQSKTETVQRLKFNEPVMFAPADYNCGHPRKVGDYYEIKSGLGECLYHMKTEDGRLGRFILVSYQGVLVREAQ